ncbi:MAG: LTA synthase family protein [Lachnospiraceae bacterium]|nr:LTA synthase family protein [Lachnospiraceae bacterium]
MNKIKNIWSWIILIAAPILIFYATQYIICDIAENVRWKMQIANAVFYEVTAWFLILLTGRTKLALRIELAFMWFFALADAYIYIFRDSYIQPWDILSFHTAMNVAGNFSFVPDQRMMIGTVMCLGIFVLTFFCDVDIRKMIRKASYRLAAAVALLACLVAFGKGMQSDEFSKSIGFHEGKFRLYVTTQYNGYVMGFLNKMKYLSVEKPVGYSSKEERGILEDIKTDESAASEDMPDIVVVMNEAFSDPLVDGSFTTNVDYMPFIHSLEKGGENAITGYVNVSVNGGNTPNSEFEFLTGNSLAFLPEGSIPYQSYVNGKIDALPWYLGSLGYHTIGQHDYEASGWNRTVVYPRLGFEEVHFEDYFYEYDPSLVRNYISDASLFDQISYQLDNREDSDAPIFSFSVSMQNHSDYDGDPENFERTVFVDGLDDIEDKYVKRLSNYLSLVRLSDKALEDFTEKYKDSDRKLIVVMFGDHQPSASVLRNIYELNGGSHKELDEEATNNLYRVPFVIWANYDIEEQNGVETSLNYLGNYVLNTAGIPLNKYRSFLEEFEKDFPVVSAIRAVDGKGETKPLSEAMNDLSDYKKMQYYELFDDKDDYK